MRRDNQNQEDIGGRLRRARQRQRLSQSDVAKRLGVDQATISRIENHGASNKRTIYKVLEFLNASEVIDNDVVSRIANIVAESDEMKALVRRIAAEL